MITEYSRDSISEITEMSDKSGLHHFCAALGWGTSAGTVTLMAGLAMDLGLGTHLGELGAAIAFFGFFVAFFTLITMVLIGLPITFLLRKMRAEKALVYAGLGAVAGFAVLAVLAVLFDPPAMVSAQELMILFAGAFAGFSCALRWGKWREKTALALHDQDRERASDRRSNPIHDLIH